MSKIRNAAAFIAVSLVFLFLLPANFISSDVHAVDTLEVATGMMLPDGFDVLADGKGNFVITSYDNSSQQSTIAYLNTANGVPSLTHINYFHFIVTENIDYKYTTASCYRDLLLGLENCVLFTYLDADKTVAKKISIDVENCQCDGSGTLDLDSIIIDSPLKVAVYDDFIFFVNNTEKSPISCYDSNFEQLDTAGLTYGGKAFHSIFTDVSREYLYALNSSNNLVRYNIASGDYTFEAPETLINVSNLKFVTDNIFVTPDKRIITLNNASFKSDSEVEIAAEITDFPYCVVAGFEDASILIKTGDKVISRIRCSDGAVTGKIELTEDILAISKSGDKIIAVTGAGTGSNKHIALLKETDIEEVTPAEPSNPGDGSSGEGGDNNNPPSGAEDDAITSDIYTVDIQSYTITGIEPGTTFAAFKNNLIFNAYSLALKDANGNPKTGNSTKIATGYVVSFIRDGAEKVSFKLIVKGDVTGTGTLTSRDISAFENYLLGKAELSEESLQAANINGDGDQDVIDLFLMSKLMQK